MWDLSGENLSSRFPTKYNSNNSTRLQRIARILNFYMKQVYKFRFDTSQNVNNKDAHQTAQMPRLVCTFVVSMQTDQIFSRRGSYTNGANLWVLGNRRKGNLLRGGGGDNGT